jgi:hypothetical protein
MVLIARSTHSRAHTESLPEADQAVVLGSSFDRKH